MNILSLSCVFPSPADPGRGLFVHSRLRHMAAVANLKVIAPVEQHAHSAAVPLRRIDGPMEIFHPKWVHVPGTGLLTAGLLFCQLLRPVCRLKKDFPFQVIDSHFAFPEGIAAALLARRLHIPFVVTLRGCEMLHSQYRLRRRGMSWALRNAALVITVSERLRQLAIKLGVDPQRTVVIPNGIDSAVFHARSRAECRLRHRLSPHRYTILTAGHLIELKGHHRAIEALKKLLDEGIDAQLVIVGGAPSGGVPEYELELHQVASHLQVQERVHFAGQVSQTTLAELMAAADIFCLASSREGWPNVLHEALACGIPAVATDVGAVPAMIPSDQYGFIVPANDVSALTAALQRAATTHWEPAVIAAWAQSRSWEQVARDVIGRLQEIVAQA